MRTVLCRRFRLGSRVYQLQQQAAELTEHLDADRAGGFSVGVFQRDGVISRVGHFHVADARRRHVADDVNGDAESADQWPAVEVPRDPRGRRGTVGQLHDDRFALLERQRLVYLLC